MYRKNKSKQIHAIAKAGEEQYGGALPCDRDKLMELRGVGPKCANLAIGIGCDVPFIGVDVHVHRITNRWGYVKGDDAGEDPGGGKRRSCRRSIGYRSMNCWCRSASTSAGRRRRGARRVRSRRCVLRWG